MSPKTHLPDSRPIGAEHSEVLDLQAIHAKIWAIDHPPIPPRGDTMQRILEALRTFGLDKCRAAILGHHRQAKKDGSFIGKDLRSVFPSLSNGGRKDDRKLDTDRVLAYVQDAPRESSGNGNGKYGAMGRYWSKEEIRAIRAKSEEQLNQAERYVRANCPEKYWS
jgi:hypothetical protein